jgi:phospholipid/cholesterol/gamma-HCH transport system ATP-binding protein
MIKIRDLSKSFGKNRVLEDINLDIKEGETTVVIGQSGVGKSVLIKHIIGLLKPDKGAIYVDGDDITKYDSKKMKEYLKRFGILFQNAALFDSMSVGENVAFPLREHTNLSNEEIKVKVAEKLHLVGLAGIEDMYPSELSGGMRKRLGLARAIALDPEIMIFDEPTTGLDPVISDAIDNLIIETQKKLNLTNVVISHDIPGTFKIAHKIAMLYDCRLIETGAPEEFKNSPNPIVQQFLARKAEGPMKI